jgi:rSAM/selenodomain-associated transferase 1
MVRGNVAGMNHVTVFARPPLPGRVKSRLSPALPAALAARLYGALLADALAAAAACGADARAIAWSDAEGAMAPPPGFSAYTQAPGDLGARLAHAFQRALATPASRAVIVGSDCPTLRSAQLDAAFAALARHDVVVGPASDGGYWLLGLAQPAPGLLRDVPWSTDAVCATTLERAAALGLRVARLETLADLDTPADLAALVGECARGCENACGPRTHEALRGMGLLP